jgi:transmembrane sensor
MEEIIIKECTNQKLSRSEKFQLEMWLKESATNRRIYGQLKLSLLYPDSEKMAEMQDEVWNDIQSRLNRQKAVGKKQVSFGYWYKVAAVVVFCISIVFTLYKSQRNISDYKPALVEIKIIEKVSLPGQKVTTRLPDGTIVKLNSDSKILVPEKFSDSLREIELYGEAFFDVVRDESKPFIIRTKDLRIEVLGTSFNVRSYPEENCSVVAVASGEVAVSDGEKELKNLVKGEKIAYKKGAKMLKVPYDWEKDFGWKDNILLLQNKNLPEIVEILKRWYGVQFKVESNILASTEKFSGRYHDPTLRAVLEGISFIYDFSYQIDGKIVTIK